MNREDLIGAYLAGALQGLELKKFEHELENDPALRADVDAVESFIDTIDDTQEFPEILEMIKEVDETSHKQEAKKSTPYIRAFVIGLVSLIIIICFLLYKSDKPIVPTDNPKNDSAVFATNFNDFINKKYYDNNQILEAKNNRGGDVITIDSLLSIIFLEVDIAAEQGDWNKVDHLLSTKIEYDELTNYEEDAVKFIGAIARLQIDSCDTSGKQRLLAIPERDFYSFFSVSQEIVDRIKLLDCQNN